MGLRRCLEKLSYGLLSKSAYPYAAILLSAHFRPALAMMGCRLKRRWSWFGGLHPACPVWAHRSSFPFRGGLSGLSSFRALWVAQAPTRLSRLVFPPRTQGTMWWIWDVATVWGQLGSAHRSWSMEMMARCCVVGYPFRAKEVDGLGLVVVHEAEPIGCEFCLCVFGRGNEGSIGGCVGAVASAFEVVHGDEYGWL